MRENADKGGGEKKKSGNFADVINGSPLNGLLFEELSHVTGNHRTLRTIVRSTIKVTFFIVIRISSA